VDTFVVPNEVTFPEDFLAGVRSMRPNAVILDEDIRRGTHGTKMAIIAAGKKVGVAPNANLYLVKAKGAWARDANDPTDDFLIYRYQIQAVDLALDRVRSEIQARLNTDSNAKSVVNMSWGKSTSYSVCITDPDHYLGVKMSGYGAYMEPIFQDFFQWCERVKVPVTIAAGNDPNTFLDQTVPQKFGTPTNTLITVGGVDKEGKLYSKTSPPRPGRSGHMTVFAPAVDIVVPGKQGTGDTGTSQAAAIVVSPIFLLRILLQGTVVFNGRVLTSGSSRVTFAEKLGFLQNLQVLRSLWLSLNSSDLNSLIAYQKYLLWNR
jgi:subtilisin family serine protease